MNPLRFGIFLLMTLWMSGCATLSQEECQVADWYTIGFEDGSSGHATSYIAHHRKSCAKHGITPNLESYTQGHARGLDNYCTASNVFTTASQGRDFPSVCPSTRYPGLDAAFTSGRLYYTLSVELDTLSHQREDLINELNTLRLKVKDNEDSIVADTTSREQRRLLIVENKNLGKEIVNLEADLHDIDLWIDDKEYELNNFSEYRHHP